MISVDEILAFSQAHPSPIGWPPEMVTRFVTDLVSSPDLVFEVNENGNRVAIAVLIDRVKNAGNDATLEILGLRKDADCAAVLNSLLAIGKSRLPGNRSSITLGLPASFPHQERIASEQGMAPYYETYGMLHDSPMTVAPPPAGLCTIVTDRDEEELYGVLTTSFAESLDTNIPAFADWQATRRAPSRSKTWGVWIDKKLVAFLNLSVPRAVALAEIRTVGVLPEFRGRGYAQALIRRAMQYVAQLEISRCALTVSVQNERALELYRKIGFKEVDRQRVWRWIRA